MGTDILITPVIGLPRKVCDACSFGLCSMWKLIVVWTLP